jgi:hypothetical protein
MLHGFGTCYMGLEHVTYVLDMLHGFGTCYKANAPAFSLCQTLSPTHAFFMEFREAQNGIQKLKWACCTSH